MTNKVNQFLDSWLGIALLYSLTFNVLFLGKAI